MKYIILIIIILGSFFVIYTNSGIEPLGKRILFSKKAFKYALKETENYIKECDDGYFYFASKKNGADEITYERVSSYSVSVIHKNIDSLERSGFFEAHNQEILRNHQWEKIHQNIIGSKPLRSFLAVNGQKDSINLFSSFKSVSGHKYLLKEQFNCPKTKNNNEK